MGDFLFGSDPEPAKPYQGPQFANQEAMLSNAVMGAMAAQNPSLMGYMGSSNQQQPQFNFGSAPQYSSTPNSLPQGGGGIWGSPNLQGTKTPPIKTWGNQTSNNYNAFTPQGFQQAGQYIPGQMTYNQPSLNFSQRTPYQFAETPQVNIQDLYTPQYNMARDSINEQAARTEEQMLANLNARGMLTSGAANKAVMDLARERDDRLSDLSSQYSIEQGRMQMQEEQMRRQMESDRQINQAAEIFRQQGASDEQAMFLAQQSLAGFNANLQGRQQATSEEQLANMIRRQPLQDLFQLYGMQTGQIGGTPGSPGLVSSVLSSAAGGLTGGIGGAIGGRMFG